MLWKQLEFRYPENIIFMLIPFLLLLILILGYRKKEENPGRFTSEDRQGFRLSGYFSAYPGFGFAGHFRHGPPDFHWLPGGTERGA